MTTDKRRHARIAVPLNARVLVGSLETEFEVRDVSRGGILLLTRSPPGVVGTTLTLKLALTAGIKPLVVKGRIVRIIPDPKARGGGVLGMGLQFTFSEPGQQDALLSMLERALLGRGTNSRAYPRVYQVLDVTCHAKKDVRGLVGDIGEGGAGLTLDQALTKEEEVTLEMVRPEGSPLTLQGWVVSTEPLPRTPGKHRVGVRFGKMTPQLRTELKALIASLVKR